MVRAATNGPSLSTIAALQVVLLLTFCTLRVTYADGDNDCPQEARIDLSSATQNGSGFVTESGDLFPENVTKIVDGARRGCVCDLKPCLALCPPEEPDTKTYYDDDEVNYAAIPRVYNVDGTIDDVADARGPEIRKWFQIIVSRPCPEYPMYPLLPTEDELDEFYLLENGSLFFPRLDDPSLRFMGLEDYCLRLEQDNTSLTPWACSPEKSPQEELGVVKNAQYIGRLVTVPFIIATVFVYSVIPKLRNIHGTTLRCYLCCLTITNVALPLDRIPGPDFDAGPWCLFLGFTIYFSLISGFLWLNVICLDLWWRFGGCGSLRSTGALYGRRKFFWYSIYAWGISVVMTAICIGMEFAPGIPNSVIRPGFRLWACWFSTKEATILYYIGPTGLIIFCNICLFISTAIKLARHKKTTKRHFNSRNSRRHNHKTEWFGLHLRLFVVMGACWSTDTIASLWKGPKYLWFITDMITALQGFLIFLIFVCKRSVWVSLKQRYAKKLATSQGVGTDMENKKSVSHTTTCSQLTQEDTLH